MNWRKTLAHRSFPALSVGLMILINAIVLAVWIHQDNQPPHWDMANHLVNALRYHDHLVFGLGRHGGLSAIKYFFLDYYYYPPGYYWTTLPLTLIGRSADILVLVNILYLAIFTGGVFLIARRVTTIWLTLLAVIVGLCLPFVVSQTHQYQLDFVLTAVVTLGIAALLSSQQLTHRGWTIAFGALVGLSMLIKWSAVGFYFLPTLLVIGQALRLPNRKTAFLNLALGFIAFLVIIGPWFGYNFSKVRSDFAGNISTGVLEGDPPVFSAASWKWYLRVFPFEHIRGLLLPFFLIGLTWLFTKVRQSRDQIVLLVFLVGGYLVMTLYQNKDYRFIMPLNGVAAVIIVYWLCLVPKWLMRTSAIYLLATSLIVFWSITFGLAWLPRNVSWHVANGWELPIFKQLGYFSEQPDRRSWPNEQIVQDIVEFSQGQLVRLAMDYYDYPYFNKENFRYLIFSHRFPIEITYPYQEKFVCNDTDFMLRLNQGEGKIKYSTDNLTDSTNSICRLTLLKQYNSQSAGTANLYKVSHD